MADTPLVGLIDYHSGEVTRQCIDSVLATAAGPVEIVVVDNGGSVEIDLPAVTVIRPGRNLGFAGGCNLLVEQARATEAPWLWILNNDCTVEPGWQPQIGSAIELGLADIYTTVSLQGATDLVWFAGGDYDESTNRHSHLHYGERAKDLLLPELATTAWASGANMIVPRRTFATSKPFDEHLFLYREEFDWQWSQKFKVGLLGAPLVRHYAGSTNRCVGATLETFFSARNSWITGNRYLDGLAALRFWLAWLVDFILKPIVKRDLAGARAGWLGIRCRELDGPASLAAYRRMVSGESSG